MKTKKSGSYLGSWSLILLGVLSLPFGGAGLLLVFVGFYSVIVNTLHPTPTKIIMCSVCEKTYSIKMWNTMRVKLHCSSCGYYGWMRVIKENLES